MSVADIDGLHSPRTQVLLPLSFAVGLGNVRVIGPLLQALLVPELCELSKDGQGSHRHKRG